MPDADGDVAPPTWEELAERNSRIAGIDDGALARFRERAVAVPVGVARARVRLRDARRQDVPVSVIGTRFDAATRRKTIASGDMPSELGSVRKVHFVDLPTGHWPLLWRAEALAAGRREEITRR